jgi:hypothetical protein
MTSSLYQLVNEYEAAAIRLTDLHRRWAARGDRPFSVVRGLAATCSGVR